MLLHVLCYLKKKKKSKAANTWLSHCSFALPPILWWASLIDPNTLHHLICTLPQKSAQQSCLRQMTPVGWSWVQDEK